MPTVTPYRSKLDMTRFREVTGPMARKVHSLYRGAAQLIADQKRTKDG